MIFVQASPSDSLLVSLWEEVAGPFWVSQSAYSQISWVHPLEVSPLVAQFSAAQLASLLVKLACRFCQMVYLLLTRVSLSVAQTSGTLFAGPPT